MKISEAMQLRPLFKAVANPPTMPQPNVYLFVFVYAVWLGGVPDGHVAARQQIPSMAPMHCSNLDGVGLGGLTSHDLRPRNEAPTSSYSSYAFVAGE